MIRYIIIVFSWMSLFLVIIAVIDGILNQGKDFVTTTKAAGRIPDLTQTK